jgi:adenosylmethionine-8-amino-7-oxononanoate aminotransferase
MERILTNDYVFHRDFTKEYPIISYGKGIYLYDKNGKSYIDACSGAVAANLGHGIEEIAQAIADQAKKAAFVHTMRFETDILHLLSEKIGKLAPEGLNRVYFTTGGSEANESAIKLARQYHKDSGKQGKHVVIGRWQSYHGNTFGSLSAGGDIKRRQPYTPNLLPFEHIYSPNCRHCPYNREKGDCDTHRDWSCVQDFERLILQIGPENISAFIAEPITGSQLGAVAPPQDYFKEIREICDRYDILLILDEVMTGFGRTGKHFALEHFGVTPDIITFGKGVSAGYAPLAGMIASDKIIDSLIQNSQGKFIHGYTYSGHPVSVAAGLSALRIYERENIVENAKVMGSYLLHKLLELKEKYPVIADVRGEGLLIGIELLKSIQPSAAFPANYKISERLNELAMELGAVIYPGSGSIDGVAGDHFIISPPLNISKDEIDEIIIILDHSLKLLIQELKEALAL